MILKKASFGALCLGVILAVAYGCMGPPIMSAAECQSFCRADGKTVKQYRVGGVVPIFHPRPTVICECE
jgi:hypothetical protein